MMIRWHFSNLVKFTAYIAVLAGIASLFSINVVAQESDFKFNEITQINAGEKESLQWLPLVAHPSNNQQHFIANDIGQIYFVEESKKPLQVLDLNTKHTKGVLPLQLTAIELHPNFALRDQLGYGTFYTAHLEPLDKNSRTKRIQERGNELALKFDAVVTEWRFNSRNYQSVELSSKREVLRIAVPDNDLTIKQMSFSPFTKSWNEGFGLLYIALSGQKKWQKPLYSGVILRINPAKFGLRSFTVPTSNPYVKESEIKDEIYLLGGQNIKQFIWPDKSKDDILLSHSYNGKGLLSLAHTHNDWRIAPPKKVLYQSENLVEGVLLYRGANLPDLRNKLLLLTKVDRTWRLESLNLHSSTSVDRIAKNTPQLEWDFSQENLAYGSNVSLVNNRNGEILVVDETSGKVFEISLRTTNKNIHTQKRSAAIETQSESPNYIYMFLVLITIMGSAFYFFNRNKVSAKAIVRKQFAHIELSESQQQIGLYHRHSKNIDTIIDITDIAMCEVKLNGNSVSVINNDVGHGFTEDKEQDLRAIFSKEKVDKMIEGKIRQVNLSLTDRNDKNYIVCLYMRKGSNRVTKKTYSVVIEDLIDWCWLIAAKINVEQTGIRKQKTVLASSAPIKNNNAQNQKSLHDEAAASRLAIQKAAQVQKRAESELQNEPEINESADPSTKAKPSGAVDTNLVNALEKLVKLRQQGFLTQEEFTTAKENLLRSLSE